MTEATTDRPSPARVRRPGVSVRFRITATVAALVTIALAGAGLIVYVVERGRVDASVQREVEQELDEFAALEGNAIDPDTRRPVDSVDALLKTFLRRNVPDDDEMLVGWVGDSPRYVFPEDDLTQDPEFLASTRPLVTRGGTTRMDTDRGEVRITSQPVRQGDTTGALIVVAFLDEDRAELAATMRTYAIVALLSLLLVTSVAAWQSGRLLRPLRALRDTADEIRGTDLSRRIPETGNDDISALTRTVNEMLDRLETSFSHQRHFLDAAGHELKTPLTVLRGHLELLDTGSPAEVAETRALLLDETDRMSRLVEDLILLAKSDRPDFLTRTEQRPDDLVRSVLAKARALGDRSWVLDVQPDATPDPLLFDAQRLTQALLALCDNAVKHTTSGQQIGIGARVTGGDLVCWVRDSGAGVPLQDRERIFGRFERARVPDGDEGFGLGLSIVQAIARAHGGSAFVDDADSGGARFVVMLPAIRATAVSADPDDIPTRDDEEPRWPAS